MTTDCEGTLELLRRFLPAWLGCALMQLMAVGLFYPLPAQPWRPVLMVATNLLTLAALVVGTRRLRPTAAAGWYLLAAGQVLHVAGWLRRFLEPTAATLPVPSGGQALFFASGGLSLAGLVWLARAHGARRGALIEAAILATAVGVPAWVVLLAGDAGSSRSPLTVNLGYVAMDVLVVAAAATFAFTAGRSPRPLLLVGWAVLQLGADLALNVQLRNGWVPLGGAVSAGWLASMALLSGAALHPAAAAAVAARPRFWRHVIVGAVVVPLPALLVLRAVQSSTADVLVIAGGSLVVTVLLAARLTAWQHNGGAMSATARAGLRRSVVRISAGVVTLALLPLAGLVYLSVREATGTVDAEVRRRLTASADVSVAHVSAQLESLRALTSSYAERPSLVRTLSTGRAPEVRAVQDHLVSLQSRSTAFVGVWALDNAGTLLAFDPPQPQLIGRSFAHRDYFRGAMAARAPYVSEAFAGAVPGNPLVVAVSAPVVNAGRIVAMLCLGYRLDALANFTTGLASLQHIELKLTDQRGTLLAGPGPRAPGLVSATDDKHVAAALAGGSGIAREVEQGVDHLTAYRPVPGAGWAVVAEIPASTAFAGARRFTGRVVAVASLLAQ
ncbi:MAG TPA: cache domain-containing protein, partial [Catenuloplanes sp.]